MKLGVGVFVLFLCQLLGAQGIDFQATSWEDAVQKARQQDKLIFLDAYTTWCAPCKVMDEYVFTHELGGDLYNPNFINLKLDMEKDMGPLLASRYAISSYPTFLFLTWDGTLVYKSVGYQNIEKFVSEGRTALEPYRLERALTERFNEGDRIPEFLYHLTYFKLGKNDMSYRDLIPMYLETQEDWLLPDNLKYVFQFVDDFDSELYRHMAANKLAYAEVVGAEMFDEKYKKYLAEAMENNGQPLSLERREEIYKVAYPSIANQMITEYKLDFYEDEGNDEKYAQTAYYYYTTYAADDAEGIRKDIPIMEKYLKSQEEKKYIRDWHETEARKQNSAKGWLKLAKYQLDDGNFGKAKEFGKLAKKLAKSEKVNQDPYKAFLKRVKVAAKTKKAKK